MADNDKKPRGERDQSWLKRFPRDEIAENGILKCDEYGALCRYRDYSFIHGGIENDTVSIQRIGAMFHLSKYKVKKIWDVLENFFTLRDGRYFFEGDELERDSIFVISVKRQLAGKLGAAARWSDRNIAPSDATIPGMASAMANENILPSNLDGKTGGDIDTDLEEEPPPPTPASVVSETGPPGGGGFPPQQFLIPDSDYQQIGQRAIDLGMAVPERAMAAKLRAKFGDMPIEAVVAALVRWDGQDHVGLWASKSAQDFELEAARQRGGPRKPSQSDRDNADLIERARKRDRGA